MIKTLKIKKPKPNESRAVRATRLEAERKAREEIAFFSGGSPG